MMRALMAFSSGNNPTDRDAFSSVFAKELAVVKRDDQKDTMAHKLDLRER